MRDSVTSITRAFCLCLLDYDDASGVLALHYCHLYCFLPRLGQPLRVVSRYLISHAILISLTRTWDFL